MMDKSILVWDIETNVEHWGKANHEKDIFRMFGAYSYKTNKYYVLTKLEDVQKIINNHKFSVGFNIVGTSYMPGYDVNVMKRHGIKFLYKDKYGQYKPNVHIDLMAIFMSRAGQMKIKKGMLGNLLMDFTLNFITRMLNLVNDETAKLNPDKKLFTNKLLTEEQFEELSIYCKRDVEITKKLYEWLENYFDSFKHYVTQYDIDNKSYLTCSIAVFAYKAICKAMNWPQTFNNEVRVEGFDGGYVAYPAGERFEGPMWLFDFSSLYPMSFIQGNLFGDKCDCCEMHEKWHGDDFFKVDGYYCRKKLSPLCQLFKDMFLDRKELKKAKDAREYSLKIILNSSYGATANPVFANIYNLTAASDCTALGRQMIQYARKRFREEGYINVMTDTDSVVIKPIKNQTRDDAIQLANKIVKEMQEHLPFAWDLFEFELEMDIKYAFFFKGGAKMKPPNKFDDIDDFVNRPKGFIKKNYIMVDEDPTKDIMIKNLGIKKKSNSELSKKIFWNYLVPQIKEGNCKFSKVYIKNIIKELLNKDINLACMRFNVGKVEDYKSLSSKECQISGMYGPGIHFLIPNNRGVGAGKKKKFCKLKEFNERKLRFEDIDLDNVWKELGYFIKTTPAINIFSFENK